MLFIRKIFLFSIQIGYIGLVDFLSLSTNLLASHFLRRKRFATKRLFYFFIDDLYKNWMIFTVREFPREEVSLVCAGVDRKGLNY